MATPGTKRTILARDITGIGHGLLETIMGQPVIKQGQPGNKQ